MSLSHHLHRTLSPRTTLIVAIAAALVAAAGAAAAGTTPDMPAEMRSALQRDLGLSPALLPERMKHEAAAERTEAEARRALGRSFAGSWLEAGSDGSVRQGVSAAVSTRTSIDGAELRRVRHSLADLEAAMARLNAQVALPMLARQSQIQSWRIDLPTNSVVVTVDEGALERGIDFAATSGVDAAAIRFETAKVRPELAVDLFGGQRYNLPGGGYCSVGFNARNSAGTRFYLTAGHCGRVGTLTTLTSGAGLGVFDGSVFPSRDWAVVRITNSTVVQRGRVVNYAGGSILVSGSTPASIGASICRSGARTGYRCGTVRATNVTVNYSAGAVTGLTETTACIGQGDSGGSYITPSGQAQGVASGGRLSVPPGENCTTGGTPISWHQPVRPILSNYGLTLLLGP